MDAMSSARLGCALAAIRDFATAMGPRLSEGPVKISRNFQFQFCTVSVCLGCQPQSSNVFLNGPQAQDSLLASYR